MIHVYPVTSRNVKWLCLNPIQADVWFTKNSLWGVQVTPPPVSLFLKSITFNALLESTALIIFQNSCKFAKKVAKKKCTKYEIIYTFLRSHYHAKFKSAKMFAKFSKIKYLCKENWKLSLKSSVQKMSKISSQKLCKICKIQWPEVGKIRH